MEHIFISYSHADADFIEELMHELKQQNFEVWLDTNKLSPGKNWRVGIDEAIQESLTVLVIMSETSRQSEYVTYEWAYAMGRGVPVIPILLDKMEKLHPKLEELQHIDFTRNRKTAMKRLMKALAEFRIQHWIEKLHHPRYEIRRKAIGRLVELDALEAVPILIDLMHNDPSEVTIRPYAADALQVLGTPEALGEVKTWRKDNPQNE